MGSNPMQKMKRNSLLLGTIIGLIIGLALCGAVYILVINPNGTGKVVGGETKTVQVLNKTIKSGSEITMNDISTKVMNVSDIPSNATTISGKEKVVAKIDLGTGTILTNGMLNTINAEITKDLREEEYNMITLPTQLNKGDFIDIRLQLPNGGDYIVISKKQVLNCNSTTIWLNMYEEEIQIMSNAIIEYYIMTGSKLYATRYVEAGLQDAATGTYVPNSEVAALINSNPNISSLINSARYSDGLKNIRNNIINSTLNSYGDTALSNIESKIKDEIETLKESRESYFGTLNSAY